MVVFLDRTITLSSTAFEYNFGVNTQFYANLINAIPGQGFGPVVKMRVYAKGRGYEDVEIPYGTPIVQLHGYGNKVTFSGSGAQIQITLSSTPIPLSATDIGQAQLYAQAAQPPVFVTYKEWTPASTSDVSPTITVEDHDFVVVLALNTSGRPTDNQCSTFSQVSNSNVYYAANLTASTNYQISGFAGIGVLVLIRGVALTGFIDNATDTSVAGTGTGSFTTGASNNAVMNTVNEMCLAIGFCYLLQGGTFSSCSINNIFNAPASDNVVPSNVINNVNSVSAGYQIIAVPRRLSGTDTVNTTMVVATTGSADPYAVIVCLVVLG